MPTYFLLWFPMVLIAVINGTARESWYGKFIDELAAKQISTISLIILLGAYIFLVIRKYPPESELQSLWIGLFWVILTLAFEFGFGLYRGNTMSHLLEEYNLLKGNLWMLIPIWIICAPFISYKILQH